MRTLAGAIIGALCALSASVALSDDRSGESDSRSDYRLAFEDAFTIWVKSMSRAEHCGMGRFEDGRVSDTIELAAHTFFPGVLSFRERAAFRGELEGRLPLARTSGLAEARAGTCLVADTLAEASRTAVEMAISASR